MMVEKSEREKYLINLHESGKEHFRRELKNSELTECLEMFFDEDLNFYTVCHPFGGEKEIRSLRPKKKADYLTVANFLEGIKTLSSKYNKTGAEIYFWGTDGRKTSWREPNFCLNLDVGNGSLDLELI